MFKNEYVSWDGKGQATKNRRDMGLKEREAYACIDGGRLERNVEGVRKGRNCLLSSNLMTSSHVG